MYKYRDIMCLPRIWQEVGAKKKKLPLIPTSIQTQIGTLDLDIQDGEMGA
jgi:hypothetical protein